MHEKIIERFQKKRVHQILLRFFDFLKKDIVKTVLRRVDRELFHLQVFEKVRNRQVLIYILEAMLLFWPRTPLET